MQVITSDFGLIINSEFAIWQATQYANIVVKLPPEFKERVCGLLGQGNGNWRDDLVMRDGQMVCFIHLLIFYVNVKKYC